ncbi:MAG: ATP-binding protein [Myxococcota bacterium]|nr:ATP-binding protein [Myxococcota bacterium]
MPPPEHADPPLRVLADNIPQLAWIADSEGWIFWYNRRWFDYTGTALEEMQGWGWKAVHHPDHIDRVVEKFRGCIERGEAWEDTFPLRGADGQYRWFLSRATPIRDASGAVEHWFGTNTDVTEHRQLEVALKEADRRKDEFLATLAHELRNPLAAVHGALEVLRDGSGDPGWATATGLRHVAHLEHLIDDLLDVSRITRGKIQLRVETVRVREVLDRAADAVRGRLAARGQRLEVALDDETARVRGDVVRLTQVVSNLLTNASKFSPPGTRVALRSAAEGDTLAIEVEDEGRGIPDDELDRVFEMFTQSRASDGDGLGIGLTLARHLAELHDGSLTARSDGAGAVFTLRVPALREPSDVPAPEPQAPELRRHRILVVDDNEDLAELTALRLRARGHDVEVANDGEQALSAVTAGRPGVVLLDIGLPDLDGYEVARRIRRDPALEGTVLIAVTGWGQDADRQLAREAGFDHHLTKPASVEDVSRLLAQVPDRETSG